MSTIKSDALTTKSDNTDLSITAHGSGVPNIEAGFKVDSTVGVPTASIQDDAVTLAKMADDAVGVAQLSASGTASASNFLRGDNSWAAAGGAAGSVYFSAEIASGSQALTRNVHNIITGWTELEDSGTTFNPTTGVFTAPSAGIYYFSASVGCDFSAIGEDGQFVGMKFTDNTYGGGSGGSYPSGTFGLWTYYVSTFNLELGSIAGSVIVEMTSSGTMVVNIRADDDNGTGTSTVESCLF